MVRNPIGQLPRVAMAVGEYGVDGFGLHATTSTCKPRFTSAINLLRAFKKILMCVQIQTLPTKAAPPAKPRAKDWMSTLAPSLEASAVSLELGVEAGEGGV